MVFEVLVAAFVVMLASVIGIVFTARVAAEFLAHNLSYLISFSAGVFLVTALGLSLEVFELAPSYMVAILLIVVGYSAAWGVHALLPDTHEHHDPECDHSHKKTAKKLIIGDSIHNVVDGVILVVAFAASPALGVVATASIFIHEVLQEVSEFFVLRQAGYSVKRALTINFAVSSTILIGVVLGYFALASRGLELVLLAVSAGFFLHVVAHDLFPKRHEHHSQVQFFKHVGFVLIGALLMGAVASATSSSHSHGESESTHHEHDENEEVEHSDYLHTDEDHI